MYSEHLFFFFFSLSLMLNISNPRWLQVINLVEKEEIQWSEENSGTLLLCIDGRTEYKFQECDSDTD